LNSTELSEIVVEAVKDMKGQSIRCINVERLTSITDYMVIVTGTSSTHLKALAESVSKSVKDAGHDVVGVEGKLASEWVLVDLGGVVLHLMLAPVRVLYNLEELWNFETKPAADADSENPAA
jgi:ribosome-associated protein